MSSADAAADVHVSVTANAPDSESNTDPSAFSAHRILKTHSDSRDSPFDSESNPSTAVCCASASPTSWLLITSLCYFLLVTLLFTSAYFSLYRQDPVLSLAFGPGSASRHHPHPMINQSEINLGIDSDMSSDAAWAEWSRLVRSPPHRAYPPDHPLKCRQVQVWPHETGLMTPCDEPDPGYNSLDSGFWSNFMSRLMSADCIYSGSLHSIYTYQKIPSPHANVLLVFVQADLPNEDANSLLVRTAMNNFTLNRFREQYGELLEITVVEMFTERYPPDRYPAANTIISNYSNVGVDFGMYQEGIMSSYHRLDQFQTVIVMNDQMVGPFLDVKPLLEQALSNHDMYLASHWGGCCARGFFIAFGSRSLHSDQFRRYWSRGRFPCAKLGPMVVGEGMMGKGPIESVTRNCVTSTNTAVGKGMQLSQQKSLGAPFLYRWGIETEYGKQLQPIDAFIHEYSVPPKLEDCRW